MHFARVSASLRQGITIDTSTAVEGVDSARFVGRCATDIALEPNGRRAVQLAGFVLRNAPLSGSRPSRGEMLEVRPLTKRMTPTVRLLSAGTCLAACSGSLERVPR